MAKTILGRSLAPGMKNVLIINYSTDIILLESSFIFHLPYLVIELLVTVFTYFYVYISQSILVLLINNVHVYSTCTSVHVLYMCYIMYLYCLILQWTLYLPCICTYNCINEVNSNYSTLTN